MSTINSKNVQVGTSGTANQNFTLYQPASPDGTVRLGVGNSGATTSDVVTVSSAGVTVTGTLASSGVTTVPAGSAAAPSISPTGDSNTGMFFPAADTIAFTTNGTEDMRINSVGNVGIGTSSPGFRLVTAFTSSGSNPATSGTTDVTQGARIVASNVGSAGYGIDFGVSNSTGAGWIQARKSDDFATNADLLLQTNGGSLLVGTTVSNPGAASIAGKLALSFNNTGSNGGIVVSINSGAGTLQQFTNTAFGVVGSITTNSTSTAFNTMSDYRLKEDIQPMTGALAKVTALKPVTYKWKFSGEASEGFIAHELQEVCPDAVTGEKDAVNEDGSIKPQGIDTSFLVATLTAAIQEQQALIQSLTQRIAALEGAQP
jgi:hypothetical protein